MSTPITVQCTHCSAKLKLKSSAAVGKKAKCPKCQQAFVVQAPADEFGSAADDDPFGMNAGAFDDFGGGGAGDDEWDMGAGDGEIPMAVASGTRSSTKSSKGSKGKKRKGKKGSSGGGGWQKPAIIGGASVLGVVAIGTIVWAVITFMPGGNDWVAWMPDDTEVVIRIDVNKVWNSPNLADLRGYDLVQQQVTQMEESLGLGLSDIESVTVGMGYIDPMSMAMGFGVEPTGVTTVIRTTKPVDSQSILNTIAAESGAQVESVEHNGETYHRITVGGATQAAYSPDENTLVIAEDSAMANIIDSGGKSEAAGRFGNLDIGSDIVVAYAPKDTSTLDAINPQAGDAELYKGMSFGATLAGDVKLELWVECTSWNQARVEARDFKSQFEEGFQQGMGGFGGVDPSVQSIIDSIDASSSGSLCMVEATIPKTTIDQGIASIQAMAVDQAVGGFNPFEGMNLFGGGAEATSPDFGTSDFGASESESAIPDYSGGPGGPGGHAGGSGPPGGYTPPGGGPPEGPGVPGAHGGGSGPPGGYTPPSGGPPEGPGVPGAHGGGSGPPGGYTPPSGGPPAGPGVPGAPGGSGPPGGYTPPSGGPPAGPGVPGAPGGSGPPGGYSPPSGGPPAGPGVPGAPGGSGPPGGYTPPNGGPPAGPGVPMAPGAPGGSGPPGGYSPPSGGPPSGPGAPGAHGGGGTPGAPGGGHGGGSGPPMQDAPGGAHGGGGAPGGAHGGGSGPPMQDAPGGAHGGGGAPGGAHGGGSAPPMSGAPGGAHGGGAPGGAHGGGPSATSFSGTSSSIFTATVFHSDKVIAQSASTKGNARSRKSALDDQGSEASVTDWMPANSEILFSLRVADVWEDDLLAVLRELLQEDESLEHIETTLGMTITDIESVTMGLPQPVDPNAAPELTIVLRTSRPIDVEAALDAIAEETGDKARAREYGAATYHVMSANGLSHAVYAPDNYTVVVTQEFILQDLIDAGGETEAATRLAVCELGGDMVLGYAPLDPSAFEAFIPPVPGGTPAGDAYRSMALGVELAEDIEFGFRIECTTTEQARIEARDFESQFVIGFGPAANDPAFASMIDSITASADGNVLNASLTFPRDLAQQAVDGLSQEALQNIIPVPRGNFSPRPE